MNRTDPSGNVIQCAETCGGAQEPTSGTGTNGAPEYIPGPPDTTQTAYNVSLQDVKTVGIPRLLAADQQLGGWSSLDDETQIALHWLMGGGSPDRFCGSERCAAAMRSAQEHLSEVQILLAAAMTFSVVSAGLRPPTGLPVEKPMRHDTAETYMQPRITGRDLDQNSSLPMA